MSDGNFSTILSICTHGEEISNIGPARTIHNCMAEHCNTSGIHINADQCKKFHDAAESRTSVPPYTHICLQ